MIAEFTVENVLSFKDRRTFSLISAKDKELSDSNTFEADKKLRFLRSAVIYGANASGKSNFFNALVSFLRFAVFSGPHKQVEDPIEIEPFTFSKQTEAMPSFFEIVFFIKDGDETIRYRYGLLVSKKHVEAEYLFAVNNVREIMLFERKFQVINCTANFKEGARLKSSVRNNSSFLSVCAQNNGEVSIQIIKYFRNMRVLYGTSNAPIIFKKEELLPEQKKKTLDFLKYADIQITDFKTERITFSDDAPDAKTQTNIQHHNILFGHTFFDEETPVGEKFLEWIHESSGTLRLLSYSNDILSALKEGTPIFIDEFDALLHPLIIEGIVKLFNSSVTNPKNAQLVISCHAVNIMNNKLLRRDQIWFCEKDQYGATDLYSLVEYKEPVRKDASYNKNYLHGKYGAIPYIDDILFQVELNRQ